MKITFGEWLPDQPGVTGSVTDAVNCYPVANGYAPLRDAANYSNDAGETLLIAFAGKFAGATTLFAASATSVYKFSVANASLTALKTTYSSISSWDVTQFGSQIIIANGSDKLQSYDLGSSTTVADLSAAAPTAKYVTVVRDFVVAANVGGDENKIYWSDINDETDWTPGAASQSDSQVLPDGGDITGLAGGEFGLVFLEKGIYRMSYSGSPYFFQFDNISKTIGCISDGSIAQFGGITYFLSDDGFYACDGQTIKNIGLEKVNRWFFEKADISQIASTMSSTVDPIRKLVVWNFKNRFGGRNFLYYNIDLGKFSYGNTEVSYVSHGFTPSTTLEDIDPFFTNKFVVSKTGTYSQSGTTVTVNVTAHGMETGGKIYFDATSGAGVDGEFVVTKVNDNSFTFTAAASATISTSNCNVSLPNVDSTTNTIPLDSRVFAGGKLLAMGVKDQKIVVLSGSYLTASVVTGDIDVGRSVVTLAKPIVDNGSATVAVSSRTLLSETVEFGTAVATDTENRVPLRSNGYFHRLKVTPYLS